MRSYQHVIDTMAVKKVFNLIPDYCVVRELTERDYGIDLMVEFYNEIGSNKHGHPFYESTGYICYLQIKGTNDPIKISRKKTISFSIDKKSLFYVEKFSTPFILLRVSTEKENDGAYFLWLQRYISEKLDLENPNWRNDDKESVTLYIPSMNKLPNHFGKVEKIAWRIKYIEELSEFHEKFTFIKMSLEAIIIYESKFDHFSDLIKDIKRLCNLSTLLTKNSCCIDKECLMELIEYIESISNGINQPTNMEDYPHNYNFELLRTSNMSTSFVEELEAENEGDTTY